MGFSDRYFPFDQTSNPVSPKFTDHLPKEAEQLLTVSKGVLRIDWHSTAKDLDFLKPVAPLLQAISIEAEGIQDISALTESPNLRLLSTESKKLRGVPPGHVWPHLASYGGPYVPELDAHLASGILKSVYLNGATDGALETLRGTMQSVNLHNLKADSGRGWPGVTYTEDARVEIYRARTPVRVDEFKTLGGAPYMGFDALHSLVGLDVATRNAPIKDIELGAIKDVLCEGTIWDIDAERIVVLSESTVPAWLARDWQRRPNDWEKRWVIYPGVLRKLATFERS